MIKQLRIALADTIEALGEFSERNTYRLQRLESWVRPRRTAEEIARDVETFRAHMAAHYGMLGGLNSVAQGEDDHAKHVEAHKEAFKD